MKSLLSKSILFTALCTALMQIPVQAKTMYKWTDAQGRTFFSDQVPPSQVEHKREELDKNAQVVNVREGAKSKAELEMDKRLQLLRKQQEQMIIRQKAIDKKLLSSFIDLNAMDAMYEAKIKAFDGQDKELRDAIEQLEQELNNERQSAAGYEIKNQKVPGSLLRKITKIQEQITQKQQEIEDLKVKKASFKKEFETERARFKFLTQQGKSTATASVSKTPEKKDSNQPGLFNCDSAGQCETAWSIAKEFVKVNSTAKITVDTDSLFMSEDPVAETDMRLSLSKMKDENEQFQIFLDIRCIDSVAGKALCASAKADEIRNRFNDYIKTKLPATPPAPK